MGGQSYKALVHQSDKFRHFTWFPPSPGKFTLAVVCYSATSSLDALTFFVRGSIRVSESGFRGCGEEAEAYFRG